MFRTYERGTKARLSFSGGPLAPVNMADSMEEVNIGEKKKRKKKHLALCGARTFCMTVKLAYGKLKKKSVTLPGRHHRHLNSKQL